MTHSLACAGSCRCPFSESRKGGLPVDRSESLIRGVIAYINANYTQQVRGDDLAKRFGIEVFNAHRAEDDARVCMELFLRILKDTDSVQKR